MLGPEPPWRAGRDVGRPVRWLATRRRPRCQRDGGTAAVGSDVSAVLAGQRWKKCLLILTFGWRTPTREVETVFDMVDQRLLLRQAPAHRGQDDRAQLAPGGALFSDGRCTPGMSARVRWASGTWSSTAWLVPSRAATLDGQRPRCPGGGRRASRSPAGGHRRAPQGLTDDRAAGRGHQHCHSGSVMGPDQVSLAS